MNRFRLTALVVTTGLLAACSSNPKPAPAMAATQASVEAARAAGADELAPLELQQARTKLERARAFAQAGDEKQAVRWAEQAEADAQLARAMAASARSKRSVDEVQASLRALRDELNRGATTPGPATAPVQAPGPLQR